MLFKRNCRSTARSFFLGDVCQAFWPVRKANTVSYPVSYLPLILCSSTRQDPRRFMSTNQTTLRWKPPSHVLRSRMREEIRKVGALPGQVLAAEVHAVPTDVAAELGTTQTIKRNLRRQLTSFHSHETTFLLKCHICYRSSSFFSILRPYNKSYAKNERKCNRILP